MLARVLHPSPVGNRDYNYPLPGPVANTSELSYDGVDKLSAFKTTDPFYQFSVLKNTDGKYYFASMGRTQVNRDPYVFKYNSTTNEIEQEYRVEIGVSTEDTHRSPVISYDASGHIYLIVEELWTTDPEGSGNTHAAPLRIYKTTAVGDLSTLTLIHTIDGRWSYPKIEIDGLNIFVSARGSTNTVTFIRDEYWYFQSTDGGVTFDSGTKVYDSGNPLLVAYFQKLNSRDGNTYYVLNERNNDVSAWTFVSVIKTSDKVTWSNIDGSWTKNVVSSGAITRTEILTNCLVLQSPDYSTTSINFDGGIVKSNGDIRLVLSVHENTGRSHVGNPEGKMSEARFYTYDAGWEYNNIPVPINFLFYWAYRRTLFYINSNESFDDVVFVNMNDSSSAFILRSTDNFLTYSSTKILDGNNKYMLGQGVFNAVTEDDYLFVFCDPQGDIFKITTESSSDYSKLMIVKP